jgi:hypothetical protein
MAISVLQRQTSGNAGASSSYTLVFGSNITAGSTIIVALAMNDSTQALLDKEMRPPTDNQGNVYYLIAAPPFETTGTLSNKWYAAYNAKAGATTITFQTNSNAGSAIAYEVAGLAAYAAFDKTASVRQTGTTAYNSGATSTTTFANELLLGGFATSAGSAITAGSGYSNAQHILASGGTMDAEEQIVSATGTYSATATGSSTPVISSIVTFADTAAFSRTCQITVAGTTFNTTSGTHTVVATPAVNDLIVIIRAATGNATSHAPTDNNSDGNGAYTLAVNALKNTSADLVEIWVRNSLVGSGTSTTFTDAPGTTTGGGLTVYRVSGMSKTGSAAILQSASQANQAAAGTPAPAFTNPVTNPNPVITAVLNTTNTTTAANTVAPVGFAMPQINAYATPATSLISAFVEGGITSSTITWGAQSPSVWGSVAIELDSSGAGGTTYTSSLTGGLSFTGALSKKTSRALTGGLSFTGSLVKLVKRNLTGGLSFIGGVVKKTIKTSFTGVLSFVGAITAGVFHTKVFTAALSFTGAFNKKTFRSQTATLSFTGVFNKLTKRAVSAGLSFTGAFKKLTNKTLGGGLSFSGAFATARRYFVSLTGALSFTGAWANHSVFLRSLTASLSFSGAMNKSTRKNLTGGLSFSGAFKKATRKVLSGGISFVGAISRKVIKTPFTAALSFVGDFLFFKPPSFKFITRILSTFKTEKTQQDTSTSKIIQSTNEIAEVATSDTMKAAQSSSTAGTLQSENSSGTVETNSTNKTVD